MSRAPPLGIWFPAQGIWRRRRSGRFFCEAKHFRLFEQSKETTASPRLHLMAGRPVGQSSPPPLQPPIQSSDEHSFFPNTTSNSLRSQEAHLLVCDWRGPHCGWRGTHTHDVSCRHWRRPHSRRHCHDHRSLHSNPPKAALTAHRGGQLRTLCLPATVRHASESRLWHKRRVEFSCAELHVAVFAAL